MSYDIFELHKYILTAFIILTMKDSKGINKHVVTNVGECQLLRKIGCRCTYVR